MMAMSTDIDIDTKGTYECGTVRAAATQGPRHGVTGQSLEELVASLHNLFVSREKI